jgi:serine/threonine-protein kinase
VVSLSEKSNSGLEQGAPQRSLGPYRLGRRIGSGGMASVFEATHDQLGKTVALKVLHPHVADEPRAVARFLREGQAAARIRHPHAVSVIDAGVGAEGTPYLVMELEQGETLASLLRTFGVLEPGQAVDLILPLLSAIQHAHSLGIVHRDIKPANILIATDHVGDPVAKITDFGISRLVESASEHHLTADRGLLGTLPYMAPEQVVSAREASMAADQYSIGVVLYECLTGRLPFEDEGAIALAQAILHAPLAPPKTHNSAIPDALDSVVRRALARAPAKRFPTLRALGEALLPFASERVAAVCAREFAAVAEARISRPAAFESGSSRTEEDESRPAQAEPERRPVRSSMGALLALLACVAAVIAWLILRGERPRVAAAAAPTAFAATAEPAAATPVAVTAPTLSEERATPSVDSAPVKEPAVRSIRKEAPRRATPRRPSTQVQPSAEDNGAPILD